ncbi:uncharacterized protein LOC143183822 [Calliopsis andreniformis]|uniref:uncharacterized protein LOC143183822 n=1 Tax=Calliopsis andreniformis TaxID=337506 RepID=UPI003FCD9CDE
MFSKVKKYCDEIRSMVTFDKPSTTMETALSDVTNSNEGTNFSIRSSTTSTSFVSDIFKFASNAQGSRNKKVLIRTSTLNSDEMRKLNAMIDKVDDTNDSLNDSLDNTASSSMRSFLELKKKITEKFLEEDASNAQGTRNKKVLIRTSTLNSDEMRKLNAMIDRVDDTNDSLNNTASSSLRSFLELEKKITEEFLEEDAAIITTGSIKKKISAEPFISYAQGSVEFVWSEDTEDSVSDRAWNSLEHLNSSDIGLNFTDECRDL